MGNKLYEENSVQAIANAIRSKLGVETTYKINEMAGAISNIVKPSGTTNVTENGYHNVTQYEQVYVQVPGSVPTGTINIYENGDHDVGQYAEAHVAVPQPVGKKIIIQNGTDIDIAQYALADVAVQPNVDSKTINQNGVYTASSDSLDGYSSVNVNVPGIIPTGKKTITVNGIDIDVSQFQYADVLIKGIPNNMEMTRITISEDCHSVILSYDSNREPYMVILIPNSTQYLRYEYLFYFAKRSYAHVVGDDMTFNQTASVQMNNSHNDDGITIGSNTGTADIDTTNHTITLNVRSDIFWFKQGDIFDALIVYTTDVQNSVQVNTDLQSVGKPIVPQVGTWQYTKTWPCGFIILSKDDTEDLAKYTRMMRSFNFPYTVNTTHQHYNSTVSSDADTSASTAAQAFNPYIEPVVPNGGTVKNIIDALQNYNDMNNIEVSMNGTADEQLWDSSLLTGTVLDNYYATYTTGGGTKTEVEFKEAVMTTYASRDISQGASILESKRNAFGVTYNMFPTSLSCWTGTFNIVIDNINCGTSEDVAADSSTIARSLNWYADTSFTDNYTTIIQNPYSICKVAFEDITSQTEFSNIIGWAVENRTAVELYSKTNFLDGTQEKYETLKNILNYLYERYDQNEDILFCTRKQYYAYGKFYSNPITSLSLTVDTSVHYPTYVEVPDSAFTCTANLKDGTSSTCESDRWIHKEVIDLSTPGTYSVPLEYRGFFNNANILIESPPVISYLVENFSDTIATPTNNNVNGDIGSTISFVKNKRYRLTCHVKLDYVVHYSNHNLEFWLPDQYLIKSSTLTNYKSTNTPTTEGLELDILAEAIFTSNWDTNKFLRIAFGNSTVTNLEITNGYIAEVGWT